MMIFCCCCRCCCRSRNENLLRKNFAPVCKTRSAPRRRFRFAVFVLREKTNHLFPRRHRRHRFNRALALFSVVKRGVVDHHRATNPSVSFLLLPTSRFCGTSRDEEWRRKRNRSRRLPRRRRRRRRSTAARRRELMRRRSLSSLRGRPSSSSRRRTRTRRKHRSSLSLSLSLRARVAREMSTRALSPSRVRVHGKNTKRESKKRAKILSFQQRTEIITKRRTRPKKPFQFKRGGRRKIRAFVSSQRETKKGRRRRSALSLALSPILLFVFFAFFLTQGFKKKRKKGSRVSIMFSLADR